ncbi:MAG: MmcQ/YjbR family DNA-binding protein [Bacteroidetes bacterium]|nr:MmcQ/YjbR family DNA-binding protein [Bacteroidota bacterium]
MITLDDLRNLALSFPETTEGLHFEKLSFRVKNKIFATWDDKNCRACVKLSAVDQDVFSSIDKKIMFPVDNKWGKQGWTFIETNLVQEELFLDALTTAYCEVAPKKLAEQVRPNDNI